MSSVSKPRIGVLCHVEFEGPGRIAGYFLEKGITLKFIPLYREGVAGSLNPVDYDALIIMGGPMGVHDDQAVPFLVREKAFLSACLDRNIPMLGICLGAQLLAQLLGATVAPQEYREIGWFPVQPAPDLLESRWSGILPGREDVFHWHGDAFSLPQGALPVGSSDVCPCQGFILDDRIIGLQYHLETTNASAALLIQNGLDDLLTGGPYVQNAVDILMLPKRFDILQPRLNALLDLWMENLE